MYFGGSNALNPSAAINLSTTKDGTNSSTTCTGPASKDVNYNANYQNIAFSTAWAWSGVIFDAVVSQDYGYLLVAAFPFNNYKDD